MSKICYNLLIVLLCDCCKLLAFVGWKRGCQPFSCPRSQSVTHCRKEIFHTCLSKESMPFVKSKSPLQPCIMVASFPSLRCSCEKRPVSCKEAEGLVTQLWCPRFGHETAASQGTLVEIELLATVGWKWGCQPFSHRGSQNVTHCPKEICSTCLSNPPFLL